MKTNSSQPKSHDDQIIDIKNFKVIKKIHSCLKGSVLSIQNVMTDRFYAAKILYCNENNEIIKDKINNNIKNLIFCHHQTLVKYYGYSLGDFFGVKNPTLIMDFYTNGPLDKIIEKIKNGISNSFYQSSRQIILVGIARGMQYLQEKHIYNFYLHPSDILLDEQFHPHIANYGHSIVTKEQLTQNLNNEELIYLAPEILSKNRFNNKSAVYSFGIIMYEILTQTTPYPLFQKGKMASSQFIQKVINEDYRPNFSVQIKKSFQNLIKRCWSKNPKNRPSFSDLFTILAYNIDDLVYDSEEEEENDNDHNYYIDNVNIDNLLLYIDEITRDDANSNDSLKLSIDVLTKNNEKLRDENEQMKKQIDTLKFQNLQLSKKLDQIIEKDIVPLKNDFMLLKKDNEQMKKIIAQLSPKKIKPEIPPLVLKKKEEIKIPIEVDEDANESSKSSSIDIDDDETTETKKDFDESYNEKNEVHSARSRVGLRLNIPFKQFDRNNKDDQFDGEPHSARNRSGFRINIPTKKSDNISNDNDNGKKTQLRPSIPAKKGDSNKDGYRPNIPLKKKEVISNQNTVDSDSDDDGLWRQKSKNEFFLDLNSASSQNNQQETPNKKKIESPNENSKELNSPRKKIEKSNEVEKELSPPRKKIEKTNVKQPNKTNDDQIDSPSKNRKLNPSQKVYGKTTEEDDISNQENSNYRARSFSLSRNITPKPFGITPKNKSENQEEQETEKPKNIPEKIVRGRRSSFNEINQEANSFISQASSQSPSEKRDPSPVRKPNESGAKNLCSLFKNDDNRELHSPRKKNEPFPRSKDKKEENVREQESFTKKNTDEKIDKNQLKLNLPKKKPEIPTDYDEQVIHSPRFKPPAFHETNMTLDRFNALPLKFQKSFISELIKKSPNKFDQDLVLIKQLLRYLLQFNQSINSIHYFSVSTNASKEFNNNANNWCQNINEIHLLSAATEILYLNDSLDNEEFINIIKQFVAISIELKYPSENFQGTYDIVSSIKSNQITKLKLAVSISGLSATDEMFRKNKEINSVKLDSTVTSISKNSFRRCSSLVYISISSTVVSIGNDAFRKCASLSHLILPNSVISIGDGAFSECTSLKQITIPSSVITIGEWAFNGCTSLKQIVIPNSVKGIGEWAFSQCSSLNKIVIPNSITSIGVSTFADCAALAEVTIPDSVASIGNWAFSKCSTLQKISLPSSLDSIGEGSFSKCYSLKEIDIPPKITVVRNSTFADCSSLEDVSIPPSVSSIEDHAFSGCFSLSEVLLPRSVTTIGYWAFPSNTILTSNSNT